MPIPDLNHDGLLPPGRYPTTLAEVESYFVTGQSPVRLKLWQGLVQYAKAWEVVEREAGVTGRLLLGFWLGGSFISAAPDPTDVDCSPILHSERLEQLRGCPGAKRAKRLMGDRDRLKRHFGVEVFPLRWVPVRSSLFTGSCTDEERHSLSVRGGLDTWWQRVRPSGAKREPELPPYQPERGYLEVIL